MTLHWKNNHLVTHVGADYLRCDIYDFDIRKIYPDEVLSARYESKRVQPGCLPYITVLLGILILVAAASNVVSGRMNVGMCLLSIVFACLFLFYSCQRFRHCIRNKRRIITLRLADGTEGRFIEIEDDNLFFEIKKQIDGFLVESEQR